jgi:hypothetical protein
LLSSSTLIFLRISSRIATCCALSCSTQLRTTAALCLFSLLRASSAYASLIEVLFERCLPADESLDLDRVRRVAELLTAFLDRLGEPALLCVPEDDKALQDSLTASGEHRLLLDLVEQVPVLLCERARVEDRLCDGQRNSQFQRHLAK